MGGRGRHFYIQHRCGAAQSLGADAQRVDALVHLDAQPFFRGASAPAQQGGHVDLAE
ncbi:hypothetical protein D9M68_487760 [compost metagenome]